MKWLTIRSDNNDKFAQPDGLWIGAKGTPTNITYTGPELKGATNVVIPRIDHRETSFSPAAFEATYRFVTGRAAGHGGHSARRPRSCSAARSAAWAFHPSIRLRGNFANNLPLPGARLEVFAIDPVTASGAATPAYSKTVGADGIWGPFTAQPGTRYEFVDCRARLRHDTHLSQPVPALQQHRAPARRAHSQMPTRTRRPS